MAGMRYQPQGLMRLDRRNALGAKVLESLPLNVARRALASGATITYGAGGTTLGSVKGVGLRGTGATPRASVPLNLAGKTKITLAFWLYWDAYADNDALAMELGANYATNSGLIVDPNSVGTGSLFMAGVGSPAKSNLVCFPRPAAGVWHRIALAMNRETGLLPSTTVWVNGVQQAVTTPIVLQEVVGGFANGSLNLLSRNGASLFGVGNLQDVTIYDGILSSAEAAQDYANPWQIFEAANEDEDELAAAANVGTSGTLVWTEQGETTALAATTSVTTSASWAEASDATGVTAAVSVSGPAAWTESSDSQSISAAATATAAAGWTESAETVSVSSTAQVSAGAAWTEAPEPAAINALVGDAVTAAAEWSEAGESASLAAIAQVSATATWVEAAEITSIAASVGNDIAIGAAWTEANDSIAVAATAQVSASAGWTESSQTASVTATVGTAAGADVGWTEAGETSAALATVRVDVTAGWAEQSDTTGFSAQVLAAAGLGWTEAPESMAAAGAVALEPRAVIGWVEAGEAFSLVITSQAQIYARAPSGPGYTPQRIESQSRPAAVGGSRPAAIQRNYR